MRNRIITSCAILAGLSVAQSPVVFAGWSGQMNGTGYGRATANVTSGTGVPGAATITVQSPTADVQSPPLTPGGNVASANLPSGSTSTTKSLIQGFAGYIWKASTIASGSDKTDNTAIQNLNLPIVPQAGAELDILTEVSDNGDGSSTVVFKGIATGGTALLVRGFEWTPGDDNLPPTGDQLQSYADGTAGNNVIFSDGPDSNPGFGEFVKGFPPALLGTGIFQPGIGLTTLLEVTVPNDDPNFFLFIDGSATGAVPDAGSCLGTFSLTICGMLMARRLMGQTKAA